MYFLNIFSRFHKTKTRTFKKNLIHSSLHLDLNSMSVKFQRLKYIIKRGIAGQKNQEKETFFNFLVNFQKYSFIHSNVIYIIRKPYYLSFY